MRTQGRFGRKGPFVYLVPGTSEGLPAKDKNLQFQM
jgi:hypothetical protein